MAPATSARALAATALQVLALCSGPVFDAAVGRLQAELIGPGSHGYERPTTSSLQTAVERQHRPFMPHAPERLVAEEQFITPHIRAAIDVAERLGHPLAAPLVNALPDLVEAARWVAGFADNPDALAAERVRKIGVFERVTSSLRVIDRAICGAGLISPEARRAAPGCSYATVAACVRAMGWPDAQLPALLAVGFPCVGDYADSGVFRLLREPRVAEEDFDALDHHAHNVELAHRLARSAWTASAEQAESLLSITVKTREEVRAGVARGPYTYGEVDALFGRGNWRALDRFCIEQGVKSDGSVKRRVCDNARSSKTNACLSTVETIACEDASLPALIALLIASFAPGSIPAMHMATDDVDRAYRRMACAHPQATVVVFFDVLSGGVRYYVMDGHPFGVASAVLSFNRVTQFSVAVCKRFFGVTCGAYFDDATTVDLPRAAWSSKRVLHWVHRQILAIPFSAEKDVPFSAVCDFLGVTHDLSRAAAGLVTIAPKAGRVAKLVTMMLAHLRAGQLRRGECSSLVGKLEFTVASGYMRLGRAAVSALRHHQFNSGERGRFEPGGECAGALSFLVALLPLLRPRTFRLRGRARVPIVVYSDAMYEPGQPPRVGFLVYDPERSVRWSYASAIVPDAIMASWRERKQYITQLEVLAALLPYTTSPELFRHRHVIHFVDNSGAASILVKGTSRDADASRLAHVFHAVAAALQTIVWWEYVPSAANVADLPSRDGLFGDSEVCRGLGAVPVPRDPPAQHGEVVWPAVASWAGDMAGIGELYGELAGAARKRRR